MITPSPTTPIDATIARGVLVESVAETATRPAFVKFGIPNTSYELHLRPTGVVASTPGKRLVGVIRVHARRIDVVGTGGKYVEPVAGRPRRVQGVVVRAESDAVVVDAGVAIHLVPTDARQKSSSFQVGQMVSCDVLDGATIAPA